MKSHHKNSLRFILPVILFVLIVGSTVQTKAAVVVDSSSNSAAFDGIVGVSTLTWSHTVGTGASRALFVGVSTSATNVGSAVARVTSVTFGGQTLTRVTNGFRASPDLNNAVELFLLVNPTSSTNTITVSLTPAAANYAVGGSVSFVGVNQAIPTGAFVSTTNALGAPTNSATIAVSDSAVGDMVLDVIGTSFNAPSVIPAAGQTRQWRQLGDAPNPPPPFSVGAGSTKAGASGAVTMSWTWQTAQNWALGAIAVKAAPGTTAAEVTVVGRVTNQTGRGIFGASVALTDANGVTRYARTNPFGFYRFQNVPSGMTYVAIVRAKNYGFNPRVISVTEDFSNLNFSAEPTFPSALPFD